MAQYPVLRKMKMHPELNFSEGGDAILNKKCLDCGDAITIRKEAKLMGIKGLFRLFLCLSLLAATSSWAAEIHGRSSTQYQWFTDYVTGNKQAEFGEYLNLSITKVEPAGNLSFQGYGRI